MTTSATRLDTIGQRIQWLLESKQMRAVSLARSLRVSPNAVSKLVNGKSKAPSAATLLKIAAVFEANPEWIITGKGHPYEIQDVASKTEMIEVFEKLTPANQAAILAAAKAIS